MAAMDACWVLLPVLSPALAIKDERRRQKGEFRQRRADVLLVRSKYAGDGQS